MTNAQKLVTLLLTLALVLTVGFLPGLMVPTQAAETEYAEIVPDTETIVNIDESGETVYFTFTPETTHSYTFYSDGYDSTGRGLDVEGYLYDSEMNQLAYNGDISWSNYNFSLSYTMEAGQTYILAAKLYNQYLLASFPVYLVMNHECEGVVTTPATCTEDGVMTYTCINCDHTYTEAIPAAHNYENGYCTVCGAEQIFTGECGYYGDNLTWTLTGSTGKLVISGEGLMAEYHPYYVPAPWTQYADKIVSVEIEEGATSVGDYAFSGCSNLTEVAIPATVAKISDSAFRDCAALTQISLSEGLTTIEVYAFKGCAGLTGVAIPDSVTSIGSNAFNGCAALTSLDLGEGVAEIGDFAFYQCTGLTEVVIPNSVTTMGSDVFNGCSSLAKVEISTGLREIPTCAFIGTALTEVEIPANITMIGDAAFQDCTSLAEVTLHEGLLVIGGSAFQNTALVEVKAPSTITSFNQNAFKDCKYLKKINIPEGMTYMLYGMFQNCVSLERVVIPASVTNIDMNVFSGCTSLTEIIFAGSAPEIMEAFVDVVADVYYPGDDASYTEDNMLDYGGDLNWHPMCPTEKHTWSEWEATVAATCTEGGEQIRQCESCGVSDVSDVDALGHEHSDSVVTPPTCTEQGYTTHTCIRCEDSYVDTYVEPTDHTLGEWEITDAPTCTEGGKQTRQCQNCEYSETSDVDELGHDHSDVVVTPPTCTERGYTTHKCVRCEDSYVDTYVDTVDHTYGEWEITVAPTCTAEGEQTRTCAACDATETETLAMIDHEYESVVTDPTTTEQGYTTHTCVHCGHTYQDNFVAPTPDDGGDNPTTADGIRPVLMLTFLCGIAALVTTRKMWFVQ